ncbi:MAG: hypothetical protein K1X90_11165 [Candidatus Kapabacteria bacterium]|nr:hypothetical protein [Candidatus Kapabacteria bacterium]
MAEQISPTQKNQHTRWLGIAIWLGLLVLLGWTSYMAALSCSENHIYFNLLAVSMEEDGASVYSNGANSGNRIAMVSIAIEIAVVVLMMLAWLRFVLLSRTMVLSLAWMEQQETESTLFSDMVIATDQEGNASAHSEVDLQATKQTTVSEVLRYVGYSWGCLLAWNPIVLLLQMAE